MYRAKVKMAETVVVVACHTMLNQDSDDEEDYLLRDAFILESALRKDRIKTMNFVEHIVPNLLQDTFKRFFRMSRGTVELLCQTLANALLSRMVPGGRCEVPLEKKVLLTLRYLASQETLFKLRQDFGVSESTAIKCRRDVVNAINSALVDKFIKWPENRDLAQIAQEFDRFGNYRFPNIVGALDGCHIEIEAPNNNPKAYFNRKKFYSVILQGVAVNDTRFIDLNIGWPGRVHDAKVLKNSSLWDSGYVKTNNGQYHLIADAAYPIKEWVLTPFRDNGQLTPQQLRYNRCLSSKRQVVERAFGLLKSRFRRLRHVHVHDLREVCRIIAACCALHNVCILQEDQLEDVIDQDQQVVAQAPLPLLQQNDAQGQLKRLVITNNL